MPVSVENAMQDVEVEGDYKYHPSDLDSAGRSLIEDVIMFMAYLADYDLDTFSCVIRGEIELKLRRIPIEVRLDPDDAVRAE